MKAAAVPLAGYFAAACLVSSVVTWRQGSYYAGGLDPTVAAKAVLGLIAAVVATRAAQRAAERQPLDGRPVLLLILYAAITVLGAAATGSTLLASAVLVIRLLLITYTLYQLARAIAVERLLGCLAACMAAFAIVAAATGTTAGDQRSGAGRLIGGIPALQPNEIAQLCGVVVIVLVWRALQGNGRAWYPLAVFGFAGMIWLTASRTTLGFLAVALVLILVKARRYPFGVVVTCLALIPVGAYFAFATPRVSKYFARGGAQNVGTLNQRTVAWSAALHVHTGFWEIWFGNGLSQVTVPVIQKYRSTQLIDSSWLSALVQSGIVGVGVLVLLLVGLIRSVHATAEPRRSLMWALVVFVLLLATFESGLVNATPIYLVVVLICLTAGRATPISPARDGAAPPLATDKSGPTAVASV